MTPVRWTDPAANDLCAITAYIERDNPDAAERVASTIYSRCEGLCASPYTGRKGRRPGTRELVFAPLPYIAVYRVQAEFVEILRIWHGAQDR